MPSSPLSLHFPRVSSVFRTKNNFCFPTSLYFPAPFPFFFLFLILAFTEAAVPSPPSSSCNSSLIYFLREKFSAFSPNILSFPFTYIPSFLSFHTWLTLDFPCLCSLTYFRPTPGFVFIPCYFNRLVTDFHRCLINLVFKVSIAILLLATFSRRANAQGLI